MRGELRDKERPRRLKRLKEVSLISRKIFKREKSAKWWSDPIKLIPIFVSSLALFISFLSWQESRRGRLINEEINRPLLSFGLLPEEKLETSTYGNVTTRAYAAKAKNFGKTSAIINNVEL